AQQFERARRARLEAAQIRPPTKFAGRWIEIPTADPEASDLAFDIHDSLLARRRTGGESDRGPATPSSKV
ncbi:MAG: hypothetical protein ABIT68_02495, partial [Sphingomicrobium sp.]